MRHAACSPACCPLAAAPAAVAGHGRPRPLHSWAPREATTAVPSPHAHPARSTKSMYPNAELLPGVLIIRIDAPIYFANTEVLQQCREIAPAGSVTVGIAPAGMAPVGIAVLISGHVPPCGVCGGGASACQEGRLHAPPNPRPAVPETSLCLPTCLHAEPERLPARADRARKGRAGQVWAAGRARCPRPHARVR
jgi:hypothetical protein